MSMLRTASMTSGSKQRWRTDICVRARLGRLRSRFLRFESLEDRRVLSEWATGGEFVVFTDESATAPGLVGSYVDENLRSYTAHDDWRVTQQIAGTRIDPTIDFPDSDWGSRAEVGITHGTDQDWELFSVQWDGYVRISGSPVSLSTRSDDGSRMWLDINRDGVFESSGPEYVDNHWGSGQAPTVGQSSPLLEPGLYSIRIQYEEEWFGNIMQLLGTGGPMIRAAYVIPSNRTPQADGVDNLREALQYYQTWYCDQMERNGFGDKTFLFETEEDGITPRVHTVHVAETDDYLREDIWGRVSQAAATAGVPLWTAGQIWLLVPEIHVQHPDGSIVGGVALGGGWGSGIDGGAAMIGSNGLAFLNSIDLVDNTLYDGQLRPELGPYPLVQDVSFPWFEGNSFSMLSSTYLGAALHELTHGFAMPHDFRNDSNADGNLMGNGLRGFRGAVYPDLYPNANCYLSYGQALALSTNRYFNPFEYTPETDRPTVTITTSGSVDPVAGLLQVSFDAVDNSGLASALLVRQGALVEEVALEGTTTSYTFTTAHYTPGEAQTYEVVVYDIYGNRQSAQTNITPAAGPNRAPVPFFKIVPSTVEAGEAVLLDASRTTDPNESAATLLVEWDLDSDGVFDTAATTQKELTVADAAAGNWLIRCRVTDSDGAVSVSTPMALRVYSKVLGGHLFYNNSKWDSHTGFPNGDPAANASDDHAIASDKVILLPGQTATFANYTSYSRGINGLMIDVNDLPGMPTVDDFLFRIGNGDRPYGTDLNDPADDWPWAPAPTTITVREGAGVDGSDRVTLIWADNAIQNCWLQVTVRATDATRLAANDVFYVGNAVGESGTSASDALVNATDEIGARNNPHSPFSPAEKNDVYDYNRDALVNVTDQILARNNRTSPFTALKLITPPLEDDGSGEGEDDSSSDLLMNWDAGVFLDSSTSFEESGAQESLVVPFTSKKDLLSLPALPRVTRLTQSTATSFGLSSLR